jgi:hypothetical protein
VVACAGAVQDSVLIDTIANIPVTKTRASTKEYWDAET